MVGAPAIKTKKGGTLTNVSLVVLSLVGLKKLDAQSSLNLWPPSAPGRLLGTTMEAQGVGFIFVVVPYLFTGQGPCNPANAAILGRWNTPFSRCKAIVPTFD